MRILPLSTLDDNRTILQEVLRVRKYLEENPCRNVFYIDENYDENTVAYDLSKVFIPLDFDGDVDGGDVIIFKNSYIAVLDTVSTEYVIIKADTNVSIKGDKGDTGETGSNGVSITGVTKTGTSGLVDTYTITFSNGSTSTFTVTNGADGATGNGISTIAKTGTSGLVDTYTITFTNGTITTFTVTNGANGVGVPSGGTTGQVLKKKSNTDYDTEWADESGGGGGSSSEKFIAMPKNLIINPTFEVNQRGITSDSTQTAKYTADRWYFNGSGSVNFSYDTPQAVSSYKAELYNGASLSQFVELNCVDTRRYLLVGCSYDVGTSRANDQPIISVRDYQGNTVTPKANKILSIGSLYKQIIALFDTRDLNGILAVSHRITYIRVEFGVGANNTCRIGNTFCYAITDIDTTNLLSNPIFVEPINFAEELEKCKYYFEKINGSNCISSTMDESSPYSVYANVSYKYKRIIPTISGRISIRFITNATLLVINIAGVNDAHNDYCLLGSLGASNNALSHGTIINPNSTSLTADAEIYP